MLRLDKNSKYLLACSFGPDSMALFSMLLNEGYNFDAALVNYHMRYEASKEADNFIKYCEEKSVHYFVKDVEVKKDDGNIEDQCRKIRYKWFKELSDVNGYDAVLVAHHQDDLIETYILQKNRKNLVKYYGIKENSKIFDVEIIRPLLNYTKPELLGHCKKNNVPFAIDSSNLKNDYERNKIRHEIIENLTKKDREKYLKEIAKKNEELYCLFSKLSTIDLNNIDVYLKLNDVEKAYALNILAQEVDSEMSVSKSFVKEADKIISSPKPIIASPFKNSIKFIKDFEKISFKKDREIDYSFKVESPMILDTPYFYLDLTRDVTNRNITNSDYPLTIRVADKKDLIKIKDYFVEVRRLFIDWKMPLEFRDRWPVIVNKDGRVIYIPRYQSSFVPEEGLNFYVK